MTMRQCDRVDLRAGWRLYAIGVSLSLLFSSGCGGSPSESAPPEAYDEYTEQLTNALIGTPSGVVTIGPGDAGAAGGGASGSMAGGGVGGSGSSASAGTVSISGTSSGSFSSGTVSSGSFIGDGGITPPPDGGGDNGGGGFGFWHFDDCSPTSHFLADSSGAGATAQHALKGACVPGITGLGVEIRSAKDVITVPDEPQFTVSSNVAVAAWVHPTKVTGDQPLIIKRLNNKTSFSLGIHKGNIEMSVVLTTGQTIISSAPIQAGVWSHVAGMFDGTFVYLFLNGQQFGQVFAAGTVRDVFAPILIGATTQTQFFDGIIDEVFVSTQNISKDQLTALSCISQPSTLAVSPTDSGPVPFDTSFHYNVSVTDNDVGFCQPAQYDMFFESFDPTLNTVIEPPGFFPSVPPETTVTFGVDVTATDEANPGPVSIPFAIQNFSSFEFISGALSFDVAQPTGCFGFTSRELMITDVSVVDDPVRAGGNNGGGGGGSDAGIPILDSGVGSVDASVGPPPPPKGLSPAATGVLKDATKASTDGGGGTGPATDAGGTGPVTDAGGTGPATDGGTNPDQGVWTFGHLIRNIAPSDAKAAAMTETLFDNWLTDQSVNGFTVAARPAMQQLLLDIWPRTPTGALDLDQAPLRLQAIVSRIDLRNLSAGSAGEGRFVFGVNDGSGFPQQFTVILEYNLPAKTAQDVTNWANLWHGLSAHPFPSEEYNAALEAVTRRFTDRNAEPAAVNGSALLTLRTNEIALSTIGRWELREFVLSPTTKILQETTVKETPDLGFNGTQTFADFVNENAAAIEAEVPGANDNTVPATFEGAPFLAGSVFNDLIEWSAPGITSENARFHASLNTCNGCHGPETNTTFLMITPRFPGSPATLSPFLTGTTVFGQTGQPQTLNDLARRKADLTSLVCAADGGSANN